MDHVMHRAHASSEVTQHEAIKAMSDQIFTLLQSIILFKAHHVNITYLYAIDDISSYFARLEDTRSCCNLVGYFRLS